MSADVKQKVKLLAVDDDESLLRQLQWGLGDSFEVVTATSASQALVALRTERPAVVTLDLALSEGGPTDEGFALLDEMLAADRTVKIVLITGNDTRENALRAVDRGAFDFFSKPIELDELRILLNRAAQLRALEEENTRLQEHLHSTRGMGAVLGFSEEIRRVFQMIQRVAATDATVLITGEGGTGKELVAREIHRQGARREEPFHSLPAGNLSEALLDARLSPPRPPAPGGSTLLAGGGVDPAAGGTVFLDEVAELPAPVQNRLLRSLQAGGEVPPARVLASTRRDLKQEVDRGRFLEELHHRLSTVSIHVPPLRDRRDDCLLLARQFLNRYSLEYRRGPLHFSRDAMRALQRHPWPGNVRELEQRVQRAVVMSAGRTVRPTDLELLGAPTAPLAPLRTVREQTERQLVIESLKRNCGNITRAARELDVSRPTYHDLLKKHQIRAGDYKNGSGPE